MFQIEFFTWGTFITYHSRVGITLSFFQSLFPLRSLFIHMSLDIFFVVQSHIQSFQSHFDLQSSNNTVSHLRSVFVIKRKQTNLSKLFKLKIQTKLFDNSQFKTKVKCLSAIKKLAGQ
jgi:hypothetical protein